MNDVYILVNGQETGPFTLNELQAMIQQGEIPSETLYARPGMPAWEPISKILTVEYNVANESPDFFPDVKTFDSVLPTDYDTERFDGLLEAFKTLCTYDAVNDWDQRAQQEVKVMVQVLRGLDQAIAVEAANLAQATREFQQLSFLKRTFSSRSAEEAITTRLSNLRHRKIQLLQMVERLQSAIDFTPNTEVQKDMLLKELRHRKKELQSQRREATAAMSAIRQEARVQSVHAGKTWLGLYDSGLAADQRRGIRYAKEAALRPHEDAKTAIDRQLIKVEKDILWVERFD